MIFVMQGLLLFLDILRPVKGLFQEIAWMGVEVGGRGKFLGVKIHFFFFFGCAISIHLYFYVVPLKKLYSFLPVTCFSGIALKHFRTMGFSIQLHTIRTGSSIVCIEGSQVIISKQYCIFSMMINSVSANSAYPDEMPHYAAFHLGLHCLSKFPDFKRLLWDWLDFLLRVSLKFYLQNPKFG